jgi:hypothetical protein
MDIYFAGPAIVCRREYLHISAGMVFSKTNQKTDYICLGLQIANNQNVLRMILCR